MDVGGLKRYPEQEVPEAAWGTWLLRGEVICLDREKKQKQLTALPDWLTSKTVEPGWWSRTGIEVLPLPDVLARTSAYIATIPADRLADRLTAIVTQEPTTADQAFEAIVTHLDPYYNMAQGLHEMALKIREANASWFPSWVAWIWTDTKSANAALEVAIAAIELCVDTAARVRAEARGEVATVFTEYHETAVHLQLEVNNAAGKAPHALMEPVRLMPSSQPEGSVTHKDWIGLLTKATEENPLSVSDEGYFCGSSGGRPLAWSEILAISLHFVEASMDATKVKGLIVPIFEGNIPKDSIVAKLEAIAKPLDKQLQRLAPLFESAQPNIDSGLPSGCFDNILDYSLESYRDAVERSMKEARSTLLREVRETFSMHLEHAPIRTEIGLRTWFTQHPDLSPDDKQGIRNLFDCMLALQRL